MAAVGLMWCMYLFSVASHRVVGDTVYTMVANASATSCENKTECSLMYYATHPDQYFREDNTTFLFLPGQHELVDSTLVLMTNIANLSLYGTDVSEITVVCSGEESGGFSFFNITNLSVVNLTFFNCSHWSWKTDTLIAVEISETHNVSINHIVINRTAGVGLELTDLSGDTVINHIAVDSSTSTSTSRGGNFAYHCFHGNNTFPNHVNISNSLFQNGHNSFGYRGFSSGILIDIDFCSSTTNIVLDSVYLEHNYGKYGGNILIELGDLSDMWTVSIAILNSWIYNGTSNSGGGLCMVSLAVEGVSGAKHSSNILRIENTHFVNNAAYYNGGAVYIRLYKNSPIAVGKIQFTNTTFTHNKMYSSDISHGGVAFHIVSYSEPDYDQHKTIFFKVKFTDCLFQHNSFVHNENESLPRTGALYTDYVESITIVNCSFIENSCSGIVSVHSNFLLRGNNEIRGNRAEKGGGINFCSGSTMHLHNGTQLSITDNHAALSGGGIYVDSECSPAAEICFYQLDNVTADNATLQQTQVYLINNTARDGSALYGGLIDECILYQQLIRTRHKLEPAKIFDVTFQISSRHNDLSIISSDPLYVGFCTINSSTIELSVTNCPSSTSVQVLPGKTFGVPAVIMGQRHGLVSGLVVAQCSNCRIKEKEYSQFTDTTGRYLTFTVFSKENKNVSIKLVAEDFFSGFPSYRYKPSYIKITVEKCPLGFVEKNSTCSCLPHIQCDITSQTIHRSSPNWIGYNQECCINSTKAIIFHPFCPLGHCLERSVLINAKINDFDQDVQCAKHRTGLLCGKCKQNYSLGFGSSQCLAGCSTPHRYLQYLRVIGLSAVCAVAGILLVALLTLLNLTVAEGTLNGLIFYANIVQVNLDLFFPSDTHARPWTAFIAWLNLDFGVTVCFYDGMSAYVKTWLQFIFPLYIWIISGGIVYFSRKSRRISKLAGKNSVKVLATLFLLSFGKLIRTVIAGLFFTNVKSYDGTVNMPVWLLDANVHYLHGKHTLLFVVASLAGIVALLYAILLTFIQCLRRAPNSRLCGWILRLKPLLDAYTGPYKNKYHFWTGFLLLVRFALFTSFAVNFENNPTLNFTLIITVSSLLIFGIQNRIYRNRFIGLLESSIYINLILFSAFSILSSEGHKTVVVCVFGGWALLTLVGIVIYHGYKNWLQESDVFDHLRGCLYGRLRLGDHSRAIIRPLVITRDENDVMSGESDGESESEQELSNQAWATPHLRESLIGSINN